SVPPLLRRLCARAGAMPFQPRADCESRTVLGRPEPEGLTVPAVEIERRGAPAQLLHRLGFLGLTVERLLNHFSDPRARHNANPVRVADHEVAGIDGDIAD